MSGSYPGGGTVIGPKDVTWYGTSGVDGGIRPDADAIGRRQAAPLTAQAEAQIAKLRADVAGLSRQHAALTVTLEASQRELAALLDHHGLPLDPGLRNTSPRSPGPSGSGKTTRHQRRKRARKKQCNDQ